MTTTPGFEGKFANKYRYEHEHEMPSKEAMNTTNIRQQAEAYHHLPNEQVKQVE